MYFGFMDVILLHSGRRHVLATRGPLRGGENKNKNIIKMCPNQSTVYKSCSFWSKFTVEKII